MTLILTWTAGAVLFIALLALVYRRLSGAGRWVDFDAEWWESFSPERYAPLARLLEESDFAFLRETAGYTRELERRLRRQRGTLFVAFLYEMKQDFERLQAVGRAMALAGQTEPGFLDALLEQKVRFARHFWLVRFEVELWRLGVGSVNPGVLVDSLRAASVAFQPAFSAAA